MIHRMTFHILWSNLEVLREQTVTHSKYLQLLQQLDAILYLMEWMIQSTMRIKVINIDNPKFESMTNRKFLRVAESVLMRLSYKCD